MWKALDLEQTRRDLANAGSGMDLLDRIMRLDGFQKLQSIALVWCWWTERNKANRGERRLSLNELRHSIVTHAAEWHEFLKKKQAPRQNRIDTWEAPPADWVLINSDGAFHANQRRLLCSRASEWHAS